MMHKIIICTNFILGVSLSKQESNIVWENIRLKKEEGGYPWTHLSHHQDEEVWLNPQKLPQDIGRLEILLVVSRFDSKTFIYTLFRHRDDNLLYAINSNFQK